MTRNPEPPTHLIAPALFDNVAAYAQALTDGSVDLGKPLSDTTSILIFCQNFYAQFFENVLDAGFTAVDDQAKEEAAEIRLGWQQDEAAAPVRTLIAFFEELCDEWPEILGLSYGTLREDMLEFHHGFLPDFLDAITGWTMNLNDAALSQAAENARVAYGKGLAALNSRLRKS